MLFGRRQRERHIPHHLNFSLIDDIDSHCKKDVEFLAVLPEPIKRRVLRIWAEEVKDYRFYGEKSDEDVKDFDTEVCAKKSWFHLLILFLRFKDNKHLRLKDIKQLRFKDIGQYKIQQKEHPTKYLIE